MTPVSAVREAMALSRPDVCHLIDPHRLGLKVAEAADRLGVPTVVLDPRRWKPGVDLDGPPPRPARPGAARPLGAGELARRQPARRRLHRRPRPHEGAQPPRGHGAAARRATGGPRRRPRRGDAAHRRRQGAAARHRARASPLPGLLRRAAAAAQEGGLRTDRARGAGQRRAGHRVRRRDGGGRRTPRAQRPARRHPTWRQDLRRRGRPARGATGSCCPRWPSWPAGSVAHRTWDDAVDELLDLHYPDAVGRPSAAIG